MKLIKKTFDEYFSNWKIELPNENLNKRLNGYIQQSGWLIQYCFGTENSIEYLDFYASHRMTNDRHVRIYENGEIIYLPAFWESYTVGSKERGKEAFEKNSMEVTKLLLEKGFDKFTINMVLQSGMLENKIVEAASLLAKELHQGQTDKAGKNYFEGHLTTVAEMGSSWIEKVVGYLHDAAEDTQYSVEQVIQILQEKCGGLINNTDIQTIKDALNLLNSKTAVSREEYIARFCQTENKVAASVKLNDLRHNMDISRIENPAEKDFKRVERYKKEYELIKLQTDDI